MYIISKLFTYLVLPPSIFIWLFFLSGFFVKKFKWLFFTASFSFYLISITPISDMLLEPLENIPMVSKTAKLVVVLGGGSNAKDILKSSPDAFKRLTYGMILAKTDNLPLLFTGGGSNKPSEAENAKSDIKLFEKTFNFKLKTYYETKSLNTVQNAKFTLNLIKKDNLSKKIYLVTSAYHMKRSIIIFKHFGFNIIPKPVDFKISKGKYNFYDFLPSIESLANSYTAIHEYFGILSLILRGYKL